MTTPRLRSMLFLLGSFAISYNVAIALHEFGHVLAVWITGGAVDRVTLHPFSWSFTYYRSAPAPMITAWAGSIFGSLAGLILIRTIWRARTTAVLPLLLIGVIAVVQSGVYLSVDCLAKGGGDGTRVVELGAPAWLVVSVGLILATLGFGLVLRRIWMFGLHPSDGTLARVFVLTGGIGPYLLAMLVYHCMRNRNDVALWALYLAIGLILLGIMAGASGFIQRRWPANAPKDPPTIHWGAVIAIVMLGIGTVAAELFWFGW